MAWNLSVHGGSHGWRGEERRGEAMVAFHGCGGSLAVDRNGSRIS